MMLLVIGAQKSATSTLHSALDKYDDLEVLEKELGLFDPATDESLDTAKALGALDQAKVTVEVATRYSMLPGVTGVVERAAAHVSPANLHIAYLVRHPIDRLRSHLEHDQLLGRIGDDWNEAVRQEPRYLNNSRAAMQLEPWIEFVGASRVHVIRFDDLVADTATTCAQLREALGLPGLSEVVGSEEIWENRTATNLRLGRSIGNFLDSQFYRRRLRPLVPSSFINYVAGTMRQRRPASPPAELDTTESLDASTLRWLVDQLSSDVGRLNQIEPRSKQWWTPESLMAEQSESSKA